MKPSELCQLAGTWSTWGKRTMPAGGLMWEEKRDGWRALYMPDHEGRRRLWTRNGQPIEGVGHILHKLEAMERAAGQPMFFDGEFQVDGSLLATKQWAETGWKSGGEAGAFYAFDCLPLDEWRRNDSPRRLIERKAMLADLLKRSGDDPLSWEWRPGSHGRDDSAPSVKIMPDSWAWDAVDVMAEANRVWMAGGEGLMLKDADSLYRRGRSNDWLKVKHPDYAPGVGVRWKRAA